MTPPKQFEPNIQSLGFGYRAPQWFAAGGLDLSFRQDGATLTIDLPAQEPAKLTAPYVLQAHCDQPTQPSWIK